jgi:hypothetical protein
VTDRGEPDAGTSSGQSGRPAPGAASPGAAASPGGEPAAAALTLGDALGWGGFHVDATNGERIGRVHGAYVDATSGEPTWLVVALGRGRSKRRAAVPIGDCAGGGGRVWTAHAGDAVRTAPTVDPKRPLLREHELTICAHYGIGEAVGRSAQVAGRPEGAVTSEPA